MTESVTTTSPAAANYIDGAWRPPASGDCYEKVNPFRPVDTVGEFALSTETDVAQAVAAAQEAFLPWSRFGLAQRAAYLEGAAAALADHAADVARDMSQEMGKPLREARGEVARAVKILEYASGEAYRSVGERFQQAATGAHVSTTRRPVGVVALITPWNFPLAIPVWKLAPALMCGNTVILKVAYESPRTGLHIAAAFAAAGLPDGVLNVLTGQGSTAGAALVRDDRVRAVSFTGSVATGESVRDEATRRGKRVQLELGGHNPLIVADDADLARAVEAAYAGAFWSAGQKCTATRRIYVDQRIYARFSQAFLERIGHGRVGDPLDPQTEVGPIVSETQFADVIAAIDRGRRDGGMIIAGGDRVGAEGYVIAPTVFEDVDDNAFLSCEEVFGPVTSLYAYVTLDEALERANALDFGLSAGIFTSSLATAIRFEQEAQAGIIHVNSQTAGADIHVPFGGIKASGFGPHEQGRTAMEFFTDQVTVYVDP